MNEPSAPVVAVANGFGAVAAGPAFASRRASSPGVSQATAETVTPAAGRSPRSETRSRPRISPAAAGGASATSTGGGQRREGVRLHGRIHGRCHGGDLHVDLTLQGPGGTLPSNPAASEGRRGRRPARASWSDARGRRKVTHVTRRAGRRVTSCRRHDGPDAGLRAPRRPRPARRRTSRSSSSSPRGSGNEQRQTRETEFGWRFCGRDERRAREEKRRLLGRRGDGRRLPHRRRRGASPISLTHSKKTSGGCTRSINSAAKFPARSQVTIDFATSRVVARMAPRLSLLLSKKSSSSLLSLLLFSPSSRARSSRRPPPSSSAAADGRCCTRAPSSAARGGRRLRGPSGAGKSTLVAAAHRRRSRRPRRREPLRLAAGSGRARRERPRSRAPRGLGAPSRHFRRDGTRLHGARSETPC